MMDKLIIVDKKDNVIGFEEKEKCHDGNGILHRAFSVFLFDLEGQLLIQKRSQNKRLWPNHWSNSCCSHPRKGETIEQAAYRRLFEECGIGTYNGLKDLYKFQYHAKYEDKGSENEMCSVLIGRTNTYVFSDYSESIPTPNPQEISEMDWVSKEWLLNDMAKNPQIYTPWFKLEAEKVFSDYLNEVEKLFIS